MIDHNKKVLFVHIPKNAGTSIERTVFNEFDFNSKYNREYLFGFDADLQINLQHSTLNQLLSFNLISKDILEEYNSFAIVRNPFTRAISGYTWLLRDLGITETFTNFLLRQGKFEGSKLQENTKFVLDHFYTQSDFIQVDNTILIKDVLKFEDLQKDYNIYKGKIGLKNKLKFHFKRSKVKRKSNLKYFTDENLNLICEVYKEDFENFGYSKRFNKLKYLLGYV